MHVAALVPTRNRAQTAERAVRTFLHAAEATGSVDRVTLVACDDSDEPAESAALVLSMNALSAANAWIRIAIVPPTQPRASVESDGAIQGGPGAARNRGLRKLREIAAAAEATIMFDDDVVFGDAEYRGRRLQCDGERLIRQALDACRDARTVVGCPYVGRQDLSILEHARLAEASVVGTHGIAPALDRHDVENVAPGGISTAFLTLGLAPDALPEFPEHYNEDYIWLQALTRSGWSLKRIPLPLVHAPPGEVTVTAGGLAFQIFGEIVWLSILEQDRFPVDRPDALAAAVEEIASDLRSALEDPAVAEQPRTALIVNDVLGRFLAMKRGFVAGDPTPGGKRLVKAIRAGLMLAPPRG